MRPKITYLVFLSYLSVCLPACKTAVDTKSAPKTEAGYFASSAETMELYDSSFRSLFYRHVGKQGSDFEQLAVVYNFYMKYSIWAKPLPDGRLTSISKGRSNLILIAYEPDHPYLRTPGPTLVAHQGENIEIHIRPHRISRDFAGILLVHELSHALDFINKTAVESGEVNETKAYLHEKKAMNIAYDGRLDAALDQVLGVIKPQDVSDLIRFRETDAGRLRFEDLLIGMEKNYRIAPPESNAEAEMRLGFYTAALELRRQENANTGKGRYAISAAKVGQLLRSVSKY